LRVLIGEDDPVSRRLLQAVLQKWGYDVICCADGLETWSRLQDTDAPAMAVLDWVMPGLDGPEICRKVRQLARPEPTYIILLTAKGRSQDIVTGLEAGADDYVTKPFDLEALRARLQTGFRTLELQRSLAHRVIELESTLLQVKQLQGLFPICPYCKKVRDDQNYWQQIEKYVTDHSGAQFSHSICPGCYERVVKPQLEQLYPELEL
jgi:sigma-B regulation protein RsbU (phosphoserine phosphatase)